MATIEHFEIPVDDLEKVKSFYGQIFDWEFETMDMGGFEYTVFKSKDLDGKPGLGGGMMKRENSEHRASNYISVASIDDTLNQITEKGGEVLMPKQPVADMGFIALFKDPEHNVLGLWENAPAT